MQIEQKATKRRQEQDTFVLFVCFWCIFNERFAIMKPNETIQNHTSMFQARASRFGLLLTLSLLLPTVLLRDAARAAELRGVMDQGFLNLSWDLPDAKLEEASTVTGPWRTAIATNSPYRLPPSSMCTYRCRFYRLKMPPPGMKWLTVAAVTMTSQTNTVANLQTFYSYMDQAVTNGVDLVVFPEVALQQCPPWGDSSHTPTSQEMAYVRQTAETVPGPSTSNLVAKASEVNLYVVFGLTEKDEAGNLYNTLVLLGPKGVLGKHRKHHLWGAGLGGNEDQIWKVGPDVPAVVESPLGKVGLMICIEIWLGEGARLAKAGADLLVSGSLIYPDSPGDPFWEDSMTRLTSQAKRWHVATNQLGPIGHENPGGDSCVVNPLGGIVCKTGAKAGLVVWSTDLMIDASR